MKLRFKHSKKESPSFLMLDLVVWNKFDKSSKMWGKIDTGASRTMIPDNLVTDLDLRRTREVVIRTATGMESRHYSYFVSIQIGGVMFDRFEVIAMPREYVLVGRDLINLWRLDIDGESETYSIEPWSTNPNDVMT